MVIGIVRAFWLPLTFLLLLHAARAQQISRVDRDLAEGMLENAASDVHKYYFDSKLHGLDWDALVREAKGNIERAPNGSAAIAQIQGLLERLNDSHTNLFPPQSPVPVDYGWQFKIIGKRAYVTAVSPNSDAEKKGMRPGDELLAINGFAVERASALKLKYAMDVLMPRTELQVDLRDPDGKLLHLNVASIVKKQLAVAGLGNYSWYLNQRIIDSQKAWEKLRPEYREFGSELMILRVPAFVQTGFTVDNLIDKARSHTTLIVDLRGTPGGTVDSVDCYLGGIFKREVQVGQSVLRDKSKPWVIKGNHRNAFGGDVIVLIDSESASGAEIFARVVQLEERGTILGDHSSGSVMEARFYPHFYGQNPVYFYGESVTIADTLMADGKSLEHVGVEPDRTFLPTAADLAAGRDPVLAYAASLAGVTLSPEDAAKLFPRPTPVD